MKHTRGPWIQDGRTVYALNDHGSNAMCCGLMPGNVQAGFDDEETQIANARLIAAALEMFEALQRIASGITEDMLGTTSLTRDDMQSIAQGALKRVEV